MDGINERVKELREYAKNIWLNGPKDYEVREMMNKASDTIESLSAKLQATKYCRDCPGIDTEIPCTEECKRRHFQAKNCDYGWIPCKDKLPEEKINPVTNDFYEYQVTYKNGDVTDIRHYKFGDNHWWNSGQNMDKYVVAWQPLPEPYCKKEDSTESDIPKNKNLSREETDKMQNLLNGNAFLNSVDFSKRYACNCLGDKI